MVSGENEEKSFTSNSPWKNNPTCDAFYFSDIYSWKEDLANVETKQEESMRSSRKNEKNKIGWGIKKKVLEHRAKFFQVSMQTYRTVRRKGFKGTK